MARTQAQIDADLDTALASIATINGQLDQAKTALTNTRNRVAVLEDQAATLATDLAKAAKMVKKLSGRLRSSGGGAAQVKTILVRGKAVRRVVAAPSSVEAEPRGKSAAAKIIRARHR